MIRRVMLDIETLGTRPGSVFFEIGVVEFTSGKMGQEFHVLVDPRDAQDFGLTIDAATVCWWMQQSGAAAAGLLKAHVEGLELGGALSRLSCWMRDVRDGADGEQFEIWGNAPSLDCALVEAGYGVIRADAPWSFWQERCYRTLKNLRPDISIERTGTHHRALDDARDQARHAIRLLEALGCADWECEGTSNVQRPTSNAERREPCRWCLGARVFADDNGLADCPDCKGTGFETPDAGGAQ